MNAPKPSVPVFFLATPIHDGRVHHAYVVGAVQMVAAAPGRLIASRFTSSFFSASRDMLTARFLQSPATHLLWVDSDIGWSPKDVARLLEANKDFVAASFAKKQRDQAPAHELLELREGELLEASYTSPAFLLLTRPCVERLVAGHPELRYDTPVGPTWALWSAKFSGKPYGEDVSFCERWRALGGKIWVHSGVVVERHGAGTYLPQTPNGEITP